MKPAAQDKPKPVKLLPTKVIAERLGVTRSCVHQMARDGRLPPFVRVTDRAVGLPEHELDAFIEAKLAARSRVPA